MLNIDLLTCRYQKINISINGGKIEATGGENYPAIGGGTGRYKNAKIVHDLINCDVPVFDHVGFEALMDFLTFLNTSLDDDVDEVKRGVRYIVGYQAACIIPQADIKITQK